MRDQVEIASMSGFNRNQTFHELHMGPCSQPSPAPRSFQALVLCLLITVTLLHVSILLGEGHAKCLGGDGHNSYPPKFFNVNLRSQICAPNLEIPFFSPKRHPTDAAFTWLTTLTNFKIKLISWAPNSALPYVLIPIHSRTSPGLK